MQLQNLSEVHAAWDAKRRQYHVNRAAILGVGHVFLRQNAGEVPGLVVAVERLQIGFREGFLLVRKGEPQRIGEASERIQRHFDASYRTGLDGLVRQPAWDQSLASKRLSKRPSSE